MKSKLITLFLLLVTIGSITSAQGIKEEISLKYGATNEGKRQDPAMQKFRDNRLGALRIFAELEVDNSPRISCSTINNQILYSHKSIIVQPCPINPSNCFLIFSKF